MMEDHVVSEPEEIGHFLYLSLIHILHLHTTLTDMVSVHGMPAEGLRRYTASISLSMDTPKSGWTAAGGMHPWKW